MLPGYGVSVAIFDTNVLLYAADQDSEYHEPCRRLIEDARRSPSPAFLTWNICYEFLRASTHRWVFRSPWSPTEARGFVAALVGAPGITLLLPTRRHAAVLEDDVHCRPESWLARLRGSGAGGGRCLTAGRSCWTRSASGRAPSWSFRKYASGKARCLNLATAISPMSWPRWPTAMEASAHWGSAPTLRESSESRRTVSTNWLNMYVASATSSSNPVLIPLLLAYRCRARRGKMVPDATLEALSADLRERFRIPGMGEARPDLLAQLRMARNDEDGVPRPTVAGILMAAPDPRSWPSGKRGPGGADGTVVNRRFVAESVTAKIREPKG